MSGRERDAAARIDTSVPHPARRYNYLLGGKDNFAADRESGDAIVAAMPSARTAVRENRMFLQRAVRFLAERGIRQFLDIGTGIPTADNTHEIAQAIDPTARVVYVDNDPIVLAHARALLTSTPEGRTVYLDADLREPEKILRDPTLLATIDLTRPVALMLVAILHFIRDAENPRQIVATLLDALPAGSYLVVSHATFEHLPPALAEELYTADTAGRFAARDGSWLRDLFAGLELVDPGVVSVSEWRAADAPQPRPSVEDMACNAAVGRVLR